MLKIRPHQSRPEPTTNCRDAVNVTRQNPTNPDFCKRPTTISLDWEIAFLLHKLQQVSRPMTLWNFVVDLILQLLSDRPAEHAQVDPRRRDSLISRINGLYPSAVSCQIYSLFS